MKALLINLKRGVLYVMILSLLGWSLPMGQWQAQAAKVSKPDKIKQFMEKKRAEALKSGKEKMDQWVVPGQLIVKYKSGIKLTQGIKQKMAMNFNLKPIGPKSKFGTMTYKIENNGDMQKIITALNKNPTVEYAEPVYKYKTLAQETPWGVTTVKSPEAIITNSVTGLGVLVAVVDTGVDYNHPDIDGNMWTNSGEIPIDDLDNDGNGYVDDVQGWDFFGGQCNLATMTNAQQDNDPIDEHGHGTHVAGIIAAEDNSQYVVGVAPEATIMPVKVLDCLGWGTNQSIADGIRYAADKGADIMNLSLGGYKSRLIEEAVDYADTQETLVVAAAGNEYWDFPSYPAACEEAISVSATDSDDIVTWWSSFGKVDLAAPGNEIKSLELDGDTVTYSGTSMASPHVAGVAALIKEKHSGFGPAKLRQALESTADNLGDAGKDIYYGSGLVDALAASGATYEASITTRLGERGYILANGSDARTIKAITYDANMAPLASETVTFEAENGETGGSTDDTDANGIAEQTLTTDETDNMATIEVSSPNTSNTTIQMIIHRTDVELNNLFATNSGTLGTYFSPGEDIAYAFGLFNNYYEEQTVALSYTTKNSDNQTVSDLSDTTSIEVEGGDFLSSTISVCDYYFDENFPYACGQDWYVTDYLTIPEDLEAGVYTLSATATVGAKSSTANFKFSVGEAAPILLIGAGEEFRYDRPYGWEMDYNVDYTVAKYYIDALNSLNKKYTYWDTDMEGTPTVFNNWSTVISFVEDLDISTFREFLDAGGKMMITSEFALTCHFGWKSKPCKLEDVLGMYTNRELVENPLTISGVSGSIMNGVSANISWRNWTGDGAGNQNAVQSIYMPSSSFNYTNIINGEEFTVSLSSILKYNDNTIAGAKVYTSKYFKAVYLAFGVEGINTAAGRQTVISNALTYLSPAPTITSASPSRMYVSDDNTLMITGTNYSPTGTTTIKFDGNEFEGEVSVTDRTTIEVNIPANTLEVGNHSITVVNPDNQQATKSGAFTLVNRPAPVVKKISPDEGYNVKGITVTIKGTNFYGTPQVKVGKKMATNVRLISSTRLRVKIPKGLKVGYHKLTVTNEDGQSDSLKRAFLAKRGKYLFKKLLKYGSSGTAVEKLQRRLKEGRYLPSYWVPTTFYGWTTVLAVKEYQKKHHLKQTGELDKKTRARLNRWYTGQH